MAEISIRQVNKAYGQTTVLTDICLSIAAGEFLSLVGPSGCGKSTLLRTIAGLEVQDAGEISINGRDVHGVRPSERNLAMVFQSYALYPHLTVTDNIAVPLRLRQLSRLERTPVLGRFVPGSSARRESIRRQIEDVAQSLNLTHLLNRKPGQLSGGQRQRVAVGRALVRKPSAFLLDEPLSNLDAKLRVQLRAEIAQLHRRLRDESRTTFIYVTHDQAEAMTMSDRIAVMDKGQILQVDSPARIYAEPVNTTVASFIGSPGINLLNVAVDTSGHLSRDGKSLGLGAPLRAGELTIGFRPESICIADNNLPASLTGTVSAREDLGAESMIHVDIGADCTDIVVRAAKEQATQWPGNAPVGTTVGVQLNPDQILLFDTEGLRLPKHTVPIQSARSEVAA